MTLARGMGLLFCFLLGAAGTDARDAVAPFYAGSFPQQPNVAALTALGRRLFADPLLSASGKVACTSCHDPAHAFGPPDGTAVRSAGADGRRPGLRAVPSLMYAQNVPPFTEHFIDDDGDDSIDQGPAGGRSWDGRAQSAHEQAALPLLSPFEMANVEPARIIARIRGAYDVAFRETFGPKVIDDTTLAFKAMLLALETFQQSPREFYPYDSKYDTYLRGRGNLSAAETHGLELFNDPAKGNCARCHPSQMRRGNFPQFTDYGYAALGVPRNGAIPANRDRHYIDLGLCGPLRTDLTDRGAYCGMFRTPTLRNVAVRRVFFHNGAATSLTEAVRFYASRDTQPQKWYPTNGAGRTRKTDDLPERYWRNVDVGVPFGQAKGDPPTLGDAEVADIVAFLNALTDGQSPRQGTATPPTGPRRPPTRSDSARASTR